MSNSSIELLIGELSSKLEEQIELQDRESKFAIEANIRFDINLEAFRKFYPEIAEAITSFETRSDFCIHVTKSGHGNFIPYGECVPLYSEDPVEQANEQVLKHVNNPMCSLTNYGNYEKEVSDNRLHSKYMSKLSEVMKDIYAMQEPVLKELPPHFPSGVIFGIGLGYHLPILLERTTFDYLFVIEPDFEQFFASLFCIDWALIIQKVDKQGGCLFIHLGAEHSSFMKDLENVAEDIGAFSIVRSFLYQHTPDPKLYDLVRKWLYEYFKFQSGHGFYNDAITGLAHSIHHVQNKTPILVSDKNCSALKKVPVFIVGNGPSLDEAEDYLRKNQDKAIIVAVGTAVTSLHKKGIQADFHVLVERPYQNYKIFGDILPIDEYKKLNLLGVNTLYPDTTNRYKWSGLAVKGNEAGTSLLQLLSVTTTGKALPQIPFSNPVVANTALSFFLTFGFSNIYLFGVDNGSCPDGNHHSKDSIYKKKNTDDTKGYLSMEIGGKILPGNFGGQVITNDLLMMAHAQLEKLIGLFPHSIIYNVGNGAKLAGAISVKSDDLISLDYAINKERVINTVKEEFFNCELPDNIPEEFIGIPRFEEICDHIVAISSETVTTREDASDLLKRQSRYLYSFRDTAYGYLYHILKGSLLYYHCPMITLLFTYQDQEFTLKQFAHLNNLWKEYILEMKASYKLHYHEKCDLGKD